MYNAIRQPLAKFSINKVLIWSINTNPMVYKQTYETEA